jgi:hypothetical protein
VTATATPIPPTSGHVVLCGLNELGYQTLVELRRRGEEVVVVARATREEFAAGARAFGVTLLAAYMTNELILKQPVAETACGL